MTPLEIVLDGLTAANCRPRRLGSGYLAKCPVHDDRKPSLSIGIGDEGRVLLRCFAGCTAQSIVESLGLRMSELFTSSGVLQRPRPRRSVHPVPSRPVPPPEHPVIDQDRAYRLLAEAVENVLLGRADSWLAHRGITRDWIAHNPLLGFVDSARIRGCTYPLLNAWVIRIADTEGRCIAVKTHREAPPPGAPKSYWLPFGTQPPEKPRHGLSTFWPPVEWIPASEPVYLAEGELKAAALLSAGLCATSPTAGASLHWSPHHVQAFQGRRVVIVYDDDPAGLAFRDNAIAALKVCAATVRAITFGRKGAA